MKQWAKKTLGIWLLSGAIATAIDLNLSAAHGYFLRIDRGWLLLWDAAGLLAASAVMLVLFGVVRLVLRKLPPMDATECLAAGVLPVAALVLRHHREPAIAIGFGFAFVGILCVGVIEGRGRFRVPSVPGAAFAAIASVGAIVFAIALPLPGREMIAAPEDAAVKSASKPNVILIVLDTLRADHIGTYGYARPVTPWLDEFAKAATVYENAVAPSSYTLPSHASLFTGLTPETHGAIESDHGDGTSLKELGLLADHANVSPLSEEALTLAERLSAAGYDTAAICANSAYLSRAFNLDQGFETYVDATGSREAWRPAGLLVAVKFPIPQKWRLYRMMGSNERYYLFANEINALTLRWMQGRLDRPFFLFLNYMEAHAPHFAMPGYRDLFPHSYDLQTADWGAVNRGEQEFSEAQKTALVDAYDAQIRSLDDRLRELFAHLEKAGALENTLVIFCADHGESFYEHKKLGHAVTLYQPEIHVPLIVKAPGQTAGARVARAVELTDVAPTILDVLQMPGAEGMEGVSLAAEKRTLPIVSYLGPYERSYSEHAVFSEGWKLITRSDAGPQLFDLGADPMESQNAVGEEAGRLSELQSLLDLYQRRTATRLQRETMVLDPETAERLESIGYGKSE